MKNHILGRSLQAFAIIMNRTLRIVWVLFLLVLLLLSNSSEYQAAAYQYNGQAEQLLAEMSVEERVGQLFLVTFTGDSITNQSEIRDLILNYNIGGVVLRPENDNLTGYGEPANTPWQLTQLSGDLQRLTLDGFLPPSEIEEGIDPSANPLPVTTPSLDRSKIPLLIGLNHEGNYYGNERVIQGLTALPTNMAIGATWDDSNALAIGEIVGKELAAIGVNMLLGPSLDVLENPTSANPADLGTATFGGDPYWVGRLGKAYIAGVHSGSSDRIAVIAKHFPGKGSSDRPTDEEVPTVRKSLEQLKQIELAPFIAVTSNDQQATSIADGLLTTHIRYQGFQGNIRATTAPVSFDPQALTSLMELPEFAPWRESGGVIVSDALGVKSVQRFYDDTEQEFPHRRVAKDALFAGNDILYLSNFALGQAPYEEQVANIQDTIVWFRERYNTDQTFQQRVDEAVLRILKLKLKIYNEDFSRDNVIANPEAMESLVGHEDSIVFDLAHSSTTLISPSISELTERMPSPPGIGDQIVIFTDVREAKQCSYCPDNYIVSETALAERMISLYGPNASGQLLPTQINSFSFSALEDFLDAAGETIILPTPQATSTIPSGTDQDANTESATPFLTPTPRSGYFVQEALREANWIIFGQLAGGAESAALNRFLSERPDILRNAKVIVFSLDAPYHLDTTEISKLTAYYGLYSPTHMFLDTAVRALFQEVPLTGSSPVSISGIGYNLFTQTQPDPTQIIELYIISGSDIQSPPSQEPLDAAIGDTLHLQTGVIHDHNGNPVPDGTIVQFFQRDRIQGTFNIIAEVPTTDGLARLAYVLEARTGPGQFRITAASGEATISQEVDIAIEDEAQVAIIVPTPLPSPTLEPTATSSPTAEPSPTVTAQPTATPLPPPVPSEPAIQIGLSELEMLVTLITGLVVVATAALMLGRPELNFSQRTSHLLWAIIGSLTFYIYFSLQLPGSGILGEIGNWAGLVTTLVGGLAGWLLYQVYLNRRPA